MCTQQTQTQMYFLSRFPTTNHYCCAALFFFSCHFKNDINYLNRNKPYGMFVNHKHMEVVYIGKSSSYDESILHGARECNSSEWNVRCTVVNIPMAHRVFWNSKKTERKAHERKPRRMRNINVKIGSNFPFIAAAAVVAAAATSVATANNDDRFFSIFHFSFSHFHSSSFSSCSSCSSSSSAQMAGFFRFALLFSARCIVTSILTLVPACKKKTMFTVGSVMGFIDCADF